MSTLVDRGLAFATVALALAAPRLAAAGDLHVEAEAGVVAASRNDVRIPGAGGSDLSLVDDLSTAPAPVFRLRVGVRLADRHVVTALFAPLRLTATGTLDRDVRFEDTTFAADSPVLAVYRFDSYRLTYRYSLVRRDELELAVGFTGKIRAAEIALHGADTARKTNVGFVPLVNLHLAWRPGGGRAGLLFDADALAAPQGRAEDVLLALTWMVRDDVDLYAGYRTLEGGADNDEVYSFAWLHYVVAGLRVSL